jgi:hypothetical protein
MTIIEISKITNDWDVMLTETILPMVLDLAIRCSDQYRKAVDTNVVMLAGEKEIENAKKALAEMKRKANDGKGIDRIQLGIFYSNITYLLGLPP